MFESSLFVNPAVKNYFESDNFLAKLVVVMKILRRNSLYPHKLTEIRVTCLLAKTHIPCKIYVTSKTFNLIYFLYYRFGGLQLTQE